MTETQLDPRKLLGFDQLVDDEHEATTTSRLLTKVGCEVPGEEHAPASKELPAR